MNARTAVIAAALAAALGWATPAAAHCDTLDGPVVGAAREALATGKVEHALVWVQKDDERPIREAFAKARKARAAGGAAAERADTAFYATLVRVHRKGEGAPFTGLKPAGEIEPPIAAADRALATGNAQDLEQLIVERTRSGLRQRYDTTVQLREYDPMDVPAGRDYVGAYVQYVHYVERLYDAAAADADAHAHAPASARPAPRVGQSAHRDHAPAAAPAHAH